MTKILSASTFSLLVHDRAEQRKAQTASGTQKQWTMDPSSMKRGNAESTLTPLSAQADADSADSKTQRLPPDSHALASETAGLSEEERHRWTQRLIHSMEGSQSHPLHTEKAKSERDEPFNGIHFQSEKGENWRHFECKEWPEEWKKAALILGLFETQDFHSVGQKEHERKQALGLTSAPYRGHSRFEKWWTDPEPSFAPRDDWDWTAFDRWSMAAEHGQRETFEAWLVTDQEDRVPLALMVFERWSNQLLTVPVQPLGFRSPQSQFQARVFGEAAFFVKKEHRGQGLGRRLAHALVQTLTPRMIQARECDPKGGFMPAVVAHDRGHALLERINAWPLTTSRVFNVGQRRDLIQAMDDAQQCWPQWQTPMSAFEKPVKKRASRAKRSTGP